MLLFFISDVYLQSDIENLTEDVPEDATSINVTNLFPGNTYLITVQSVSETKQSKPREVTATTGKGVLVLGSGSFLVLVPDWKWIPYHRILP